MFRVGSLALQQFRSNTVTLLMRWGDHSLKSCLFLYVSVCEHVCAGVGRGQKKVLDPSELELQVVWSHLLWAWERNLSAEARKV